MPNRISNIEYSHSFEAVTSGGAWVKEIGLKDRNPFTQWVVQQATNVWIQDKTLAVLHRSKTQWLNFLIQVMNF